MLDAARLVYTPQKSTAPENNDAGLSVDPKFGIKQEIKFNIKQEVSILAAVIKAFIFQQQYI